jgi:predicted amidohydrolase
VLAELPEGAGIAAAEIDPGVLARLRREFPVLEHRREL